jgi:hypothetical protein
MSDDVQQPPLKPTADNQPPTGWMEAEAINETGHRIAIEQEATRRMGVAANATAFAASPIMLQGEGIVSVLADDEQEPIQPQHKSFEQKLSAQPVAIRDSAYLLAQAVEDQVAEWKAAGRNDTDAIDFLDMIAGELRKLVEALDRAIEAAAQGLAEEGVFLGRAARIANTLKVGFDEFLERRRADIAGFAIKVGLAAAAYQFLRACGVDDFAAIATIVTASFPQPKQ